MLLLTRVCLTSQMILPVPLQRQGRPSLQHLPPPRCPHRAIYCAFWTSPKTVNEDCLSSEWLITSIYFELIGFLFVFVIAITPKICFQAIWRDCGHRGFVPQLPDCLLNSGVTGVHVLPSPDSFWSIIIAVVGFGNQPVVAQADLQLTI